MKNINKFTSCAAGCIAALSITACSPPESLTITPLENPAQVTSRLPHLTSVDDDVILSWVHPTTLEPAEGSGEKSVTHTLHMARYSSKNAWDTPSTVASGDDWFVNWADFPSVYAAPNGTLAAHWLRRSGDSTYAYDVVTSLSTNGVNWSEPEAPHLDGTQTEHGFVSFFTHSNQPALVWLDGRNTESSDNGHADHSQPHGTRAMSLRTRTLDSTLQDQSEMSTLLDERVCDCCQTAAANTNKGAVVFYRDRSDEEVRDISYVRFDQESGNWTSPQTLYNDNWKVNGCPVNGPQADAAGRLVAVAWFTAVPTPRVQISVSRDSGASFSKPVVVSGQDPLGRVEVVVLNTSRILVSWLEQDTTESATLKTRMFNASLSAISSSDIGKTSADRRSGFPRMAALDDSRAVIAWTNWSESQSTVNTALITVGR